MGVESKKGCMCTSKGVYVCVHVRAHMCVCVCVLNMRPIASATVRGSAPRSTSLVPRAPSHKETQTRPHQNTSRAQAGGGVGWGWGAVWLVLSGEGDESTHSGALKEHDTCTMNSALMSLGFLPRPPACWVG